jgi:hemerythrin
MPVKSTTFLTTAGVSSGNPAETMRHRLVDAQVEVLRMYLEKRSSEQLLEALDRLIECTHASFREEEALMECFSPTPDTVHRQMHNRILSQLVMLRNSVLDFDRGRLLAQLILLDRQLTTHISDAALAGDCQQREFTLADRVTQNEVPEHQH